MSCAELVTGWTAHKQLCAVQYIMVLYQVHTLQVIKIMARLRASWLDQPGRTKAAGQKAVGFGHGITSIIRSLTINTCMSHYPWAVGDIVDTFVINLRLAHLHFIPRLMGAVGGEREGGRNGGREEGGREVIGGRKWFNGYTYTCIPPISFMI